MYDRISNFVDDHPVISSIIGAIIVFLIIIAAIGLVQFILWVNSISLIASVIIILFPLLVIYVYAMITS